MEYEIEFKYPISIAFLPIDSSEDIYQYKLLLQKKYDCRVFFSDVPPYIIFMVFPDDVSAEKFNGYTEF